MHLTSIGSHIHALTLVIYLFFIPLPLQHETNLLNVLHLYFHTAIFSYFQKLLLEAKRSLGDVISAFEFMDSHCMDMVSVFLT